MWFSTKINLARHHKNRFAGALYCTQCPNFSATSKNDLIYHMAKKHGAPEADVTLSAKFVTKSFQAFTLYVNKKTPIMAFLSRQQMFIRTISLTKLMIRILRRSCVHVKYSSLILNLERQTSCLQLRSGKSWQNNREREVLLPFQQFKMCCGSESGFWLHFEKKFQGFRYFCARENNTLLDRLKLVCTNEDFAKSKDFLNKIENWGHRVM